VATIIRMHGTELAKVRFAISPVFETVMALAVLGRPGVHAVHLPWATWARPRLAGVPGLPLLNALTGHATLKPAFLIPPPDSRMPDLDTELKRVRATPAARARDHVFALTGPLVRSFEADPRAALPAVAESLRLVHNRIVAPHWTRMVRVLEADIARRAATLAEGGMERLFTGLHDEVLWSGGELVVHPNRTPDTVVDLRGHGVALCPSVFCWPGVAVSTRPVTTGTLRYPARGVATLWETPAPAPDALAGLIGRTRATILTRLAAPATTGELAAGLGLTAGAVSQHLTVLRDAGLVATQREGRTAVHLRTARATALF
jgi:DNA-binding transcriptional ArsR family regulator